MSESRTRTAVLAGTWYPDDPATLSAQVRAYTAADPATTPAGRPAVLLVPHAGYAYSGAVAGRGWGLLAGRSYDRVVILAPNHRRALDDIALPETSAYATPLGEVAVDREACERLAECPAFRGDTGAHDLEHAVEIQIPFLQTVLSPAPPIVPLLVPPLDGPRRVAAAAALSPFADGRTLFVVSTDLTHYGATYGYLPFTEDVPENLRRLDMGALDAVLAWDAARLLAYGRETGITMCGLEAAALVLSVPWTTPPRTALIDYARSGDRDGDYALSVSYAALLAAWEDAP